MSYPHTRYLEESNSYITIKKDEKDLYFKHFNNVRDFILPEMKKINSFFDTICREPCLAGSMRDSIRVGKPNEFDLDIRLELPLNYKSNEIKLEPGDATGFVRINVTEGLAVLNRNKNNDWHKELSKMVDSKNYILVDKLLSWMESILSKILLNCCHTFVSNGERYKLECRKSGPAFTLNVKNGTNIEFDVDFVFTFRFDHSKMWPARTSRPQESRFNYWSAVPKAPSTVNPNVKQRNFRVSLIEYENEIIHNKGNFKNLIRIFKKIRDNNDNNLKSYYIKCIFMNELNSREKWGNNSLGQSFNEMFQCLIANLEQKKICCYWNKQYNLLSIYSDVQLNSMYNKYNALHKKWLRAMNEFNYKEIYSIVLSPQEYVQYQMANMSMSQYHVTPTSDYVTASYGEEGILELDARFEEQEQRQEESNYSGWWILGGAVVGGLAAALMTSGNNNRRQQ